MNKKTLFYSLTAVTVVGVGGYLAYKHVVPKALELFAEDRQELTPEQMKAMDAWEEALLAEEEATDG